MNTDPSDAWGLANPNALNPDGEAEPNALVLTFTKAMGGWIVTAPTLEDCAVAAETVAAAIIRLGYTVAERFEEPRWRRPLLFWAACPCGHRIAVLQPSLPPMPDADNWRELTVYLTRQTITCDSCRSTWDFYLSPVLSGDPTEAARVKRESNHSAQCQCHPGDPAEQAVDIVNLSDGTEPSSEMVTTTEPTDS